MYLQTTFILQRAANRAQSRRKHTICFNFGINRKALTVQITRDMNAQTHLSLGEVRWSTRCVIRQSRVGSIEVGICMK